MKSTNKLPDSVIRKLSERAFWEALEEARQPQYDRICEAYVTMAKEAGYRPTAPRDSIGIIQLSDEEMASPVRLAKEAHEYAESFLRENPVFWIGFPVAREVDPASDYDTNRAFVYAIEAARMLADGVAGRKTAAKLLEMALTDMKTDVKEVEE